MPPLASRQHIRAERRRFQRAQAGQAWSVKDLPKFYYHKNFCEIIDSTERELNHLLCQNSQSFLDDFRALPFSAQCAYVRMVARKGHIFSFQKFNYPEIEQLEDQLAVLRDREFISNISNLDRRAYLNSLTKTEIIKHLSGRVCDTNYRRSWKKDKLVNIAINEINFDDLIIGDNSWTQARRQSLEYLLFLHSGRADNNLQNQTLRELGLVKAPKSDVLYGAKFECKSSAKSAWFYAARLRDFQPSDLASLNTLMDGIETWPEPACPSGQENRDKLLYKLGRRFEQEDNIEKALNAYGQSNTSLCNERVVRIRYKMGKTAWVRSRLEEMIESPSSDEEHAFAQDFYARKFKKKRTSLVTDILRSAKTIHLDEAYRNQPERAAMSHFQEKGLTCFSMENTPWRTLFGLLFWDELYEKGVTSRLPTALKSKQFYENNKGIIEQKLTDLDTPHLIMIRLLKTLTAHYGTHQKMFRWRSRSLDRLQALIETAPKGAIASILRLMAKDWTGTKDGFPDLMLINDDVCRFIEIKAEGDVIRKHQLTRIRQLRAAGFQADIIKVNWTVDPNQTYVVVDVETTGGRPGLHRVTEIGAVKIKGGEIVDEWSSLINPQRTIPANITRITGISNKMVMNAPIFAEIADSFAGFMGDAIFAAHNVNFDYGFINAEFEMIDRQFRHPKICTCSSMRKLYPGHASYSLKNLCREFEIDLKSHHRALCDAKAAAQLLFLINAKRLENE